VTRAEWFDYLKLKVFTRISIRLFNVHLLLDYRDVRFNKSRCQNVRYDL